jgi:hypothetical protein
MPKISAIFSSSFLRAADLTGPRDVKIIGWHTEYSYGKEEYVLELEGEPLLLRLTPTLARDIKAALGGEDDIDAWIDHVVTIYPSQMKIKDKDKKGEEKLVDIIRAMASKLDKPSPAKPIAKPNNPPDDDIPF